MKKIKLALFTICILISCKKTETEVLQSNEINEKFILFERAYLGIGSEPSEIYLLNTENGNETQLTNFSNNGALNKFSGSANWNSDKSKIVFHSSRDFTLQNRTQIYLCNSDGSNLTRLTQNNFIDFNPKISPDGNKIIFSRIEYSNSNDASELWVMNIDGSNQTRVTNFSVNGTNYNRVDAFCWNGNNEVYFSSFKDNYSIVLSDIYKINLTTLVISRITNNLNINDGDNFRLSPDGQYFVFTKTYKGTPFETSEIFKIKTDGTGITQMTNYSVNGTINKNSNTASWTNDGKILFISNKDQQSGEIYKMNSDGTNLQRITTNSSAELFPCSR